MHKSVHFDKHPICKNFFRNLNKWLYSSYYKGRYYYFIQNLECEDGKRSMSSFFVTILQWNFDRNSLFTGIASFATCVFRDNRFVQNFYYSFQTADKLFLVTDYSPGRDLSHILITNGAMTEEIAIFYIGEVAGYVHRDVRIVPDRWQIVPLAWTKEIGSHRNDSHNVGAKSMTIHW